MNNSLSDNLQTGQQTGMAYAMCDHWNKPTGHQGDHIGKGIGNSLEFMDYRDYQPGDDLRRIDWGAYARSDKLTVRLYREEVIPHVDIIMDTSCSMNLENTPKADATIQLCAAVATAAGRSGFSYTPWLTGKPCRPAANSSVPPANWQNISFDYADDFGKAIVNYTPRLRNRSVCVVISDLLTELQPDEIMSLIAGRASWTVVIQLLANEDIEGPSPGRYRLRDCETTIAQDVYLDVNAIRRYKAALEKHQQDWQRAARKTGATLIRAVAEDIIQQDYNAIIEGGFFRPA